MKIRKRCNVEISCHIDLLFATYMLWCGGIISVETTDLLGVIYQHHALAFSANVTNLTAESFSRYRQSAYTGIIAIRIYLQLWTFSTCQLCSRAETNLKHSFLLVKAQITPPHMRMKKYQWAFYLSAVSLVIYSIMFWDTSFGTLLPSTSLITTNMNAEDQLTQVKADLAKALEVWIL